MTGSIVGDGAIAFVAVMTIALAVWLFENIFREKEDEDWSEDEYCDYETIDYEDDECLD